MLKYCKYDLERHVDEVWYDSSNVIYSKFVEDENENKGNLYVVFKGGKQYLYKDVSYINYLSFKNGGIDGSSGRALNEYIIKSYASEKMEDVDINDILSVLESTKPEECTYFIHGTGFNKDIFNVFYIPALEYAVNWSSDCMFVTTFYDEYGMCSIDYLLENGVAPERISIFVKHSDSENINDKYCDCNIVKIRDSDYSDEEFIDTELIKRSFEDITYISQEELEKIRKDSRSAYIVIKRRLL